jgi:nucleoside-diphosphate-sugar epimerase
MSRDFSYVDDIARGTVAALAPLGFEIINLGGDQPHKVTELIRLIEQRLGRSAEIEFEEAHPADIQATWADVHKAEKLLGWRPQVSLEEGVSRTVEWYEAERHWAGKIPVY